MHLLKEGAAHRAHLAAALGRLLALSRDHLEYVHIVEQLPATPLAAADRQQ